MSMWRWKKILKGKKLELVRENGLVRKGVGQSEWLFDFQKKEIQQHTE